MSQQYRSSQQQQGRIKKKEEDPADFMRLVCEHLRFVVTHR